MVIYKINGMEGIDFQQLCQIVKLPRTSLFRIIKKEGIKYSTYQNKKIYCLEEIFKNSRIVPSLDLSFFMEVNELKV